MQYCKECGLLVPQGATTCPQCGAPILPEPPVYTEPAAPAQGSTPLYGVPAAAPSGARPANPEGEDLNLTGFVLSMLLMEIPLIGGILQLVWAFGGTKNPTRRKLATATLIKAGINLLLGLLVAVGAGLLIWATFNTVGMTPPQYYTW